MRSLLSTEQFAAFLTLIDDTLSLSDLEVAVAVGISIHTARHIRASRKAPVSTACQRSLVAFLARNGKARDRGDVRLAVYK